VYSAILFQELDASEIRDALSLLAEPSNSRVAACAFLKSRSECLMQFLDRFRGAPKAASDDAARRERSQLAGRYEMFDEWPQGFRFCGGRCDGFLKDEGTRKRTHKRNSFPADSSYLFDLAVVTHGNLNAHFTDEASIRDSTARA
jgi:hypothetical protein